MRHTRKPDLKGPWQSTPGYLEKLSSLQHTEQRETDTPFREPTETTEGDRGRTTAATSVPNIPPTTSPPPTYKVEEKDADISGEIDGEVGEVDACTAASRYAVTSSPLSLSPRVTEERLEVGQDPEAPHPRAPASAPPVTS